MRVAFGRSLGRSMTCSRQLFYEQRQRAGCRTMSLTETTPSRRLTWSTGRLSTKRCGAWVVKRTAVCKHMCHPRGCFRRRLVLCRRSGLWGPSFQVCLMICSAKELGRMKISDQLCVGSLLRYLRRCRTTLWPEHWVGVRPQVASTSDDFLPKLSSRWSGRPSRRSPALCCSSYVCCPGAR